MYRYALTFLFLINFSTLSYSQLLPIVDVDAEWSIATRGMGTYTDINVFRFFGDTLINGTLYSSLYSSPDSSFTSGLKYEAALREDNGVVWMYYRADSMPRQLYNMNLQVGDSFRTHPADLSAGVMLFVDSVRQENYGGSLRKVIYLRDRGSLFTETWIEGIGSLQGLIYPAYDLVVLDLGYELVCYKNDNNLVYFNGQNFSNCYSLPSSVEENRAKNFVNFFPNPATDKVWLQWDNETPKKAEIKMYDSRGRLVMHKNIEPHERTAIDLDLQPGIYFYSITTENGRKSASGKLLVQ